MLKAAVFDDEYIVLEGLRTKFKWENYGIELVGVATDGQEALHVVRTQRPDIIFTDIRMPKMDGLQLVEAVLKEAPDTVCITFSGFNEFEYVKTAMSLGVVDYLEKPITIKKMERVIKKILERIQEKKDYHLLKKKWAEGKSEFIAKACLDLLKIGRAAIPKWCELFGREEAEKVVGITVIACSNECTPFLDHPNYRIITISNGEEYLMVVFHFVSSPDSMAEQLLAALGTTAVFGIGRTYADLANAPKSYSEALKALRYGLFFEGAGWTHYEDTTDKSDLLAGLLEKEEAILFSIRIGDRESLLQKIEDFNHWVLARRLDPEIVKGKLLRLTYLGIEVVKGTGEDSSGPWETWDLPHKEIGSLHSSEELFQWFKHQMLQLFQWIENSRKKTKHIAIERAIRFISLNYHKELSLQEVAEHVNMSATYFSVLFKEQMGESYIKYLTKIRIEYAKELLRAGAKVNEASEKVGYFNYRHFTELFKKHVGMTPGQYRHMQLQIR